MASPRRLVDFEPLTPAELRIRDELSGLGYTPLGDGTLPQAGDQSRRVRSPVLRALILGDDGALRVSEQGLQVRGAWIEGKLDLEGVTICHQIGLLACFF